MRRALPLSLLFLTCVSPVDPNKGRFSCTTAEDCGNGYECVARFSGGSLCFPTGTCTAELCNGVDDNCDGRIDESFDGMNTACTTGQAGPCAAGTKVCADAGVVCARSYSPLAETCNGLDDDCLNGVDDGFNLVTDNANCGSCGKTCASGATCTSSACRETNCSDGLDNDGDAGADCNDPFCVTRSCSADGGLNCGAVIFVFDGGMIDAGEPDAGEIDAGLMDAGESDAGEVDGGFDGGAVDAGPVLQLACVPRESNCSDGIDDDFDGRLDCADGDCDGRTCSMDGGTCMTGSCR